MTTEQRNAVETMLVKLKSYRLQMMAVYESLTDGDPDKTRMAVRITCMTCALHTPGNPMDAYDRSTDLGMDAGCAPMPHHRHRHVAALHQG